MFAKKVIAVFAVSSALISGFAFAEVSSKAKRAEKLAAAGQFTEAMAIYQELMDKNPQKEAALVKEGREGMANCLLIQAKNAFEGKNYSESKNLAQKVLSDYKDTGSVTEAARYMVKSQLEISKDLIDTKNYQDSIAQAKEVKTKIPAGSDALGTDIDKMLSKLSTDLVGTAENSVKAGKYDEAQKLVEIALSASDDKPVAEKGKYLIATSLRLSNQTEKTIPAYEEFIKDFGDSPNVVSAHADLYLIQMQLDNKPQALKNIERAAELAPTNSDYLFKEAQLYQQLGKKAEAQAAAKKVIDLLQAELPKTYTNKENLQVKIGQAQLILGNYTEAAVEFEKALARNPDLFEAKKNLALAQFNDKNYPAAIGSYDALIKKSSGDFDTLNEKFSKGKTSAELAKQVEDLRQDIAYFHFQKGLSYEQLGDYDKALAECRLGFEGVSTQEAATTQKRILASQTAAAAQKKEQQPPLPEEKPETPVSPAP